MLYSVSFAPRACQRVLSVEALEWLSEKIMQLLLREVFRNDRERKFKLTYNLIMLSFQITAPSAATLKA